MPFDTFFLIYCLFVWELCAMKFTYWCLLHKDSILENIFTFNLALLSGTPSCCLEDLPWYTYYWNESCNQKYCCRVAPNFACSAIRVWFSDWRKGCGFRWSDNILCVNLPVNVIWNFLLKLVFI